MNNTTETNYDNMSEMVEKSDITNTESNLPKLIVFMCLVCAIIFFAVIYLINQPQGK